MSGNTLPPHLQLVLLILACTGVALMGAGWLIDAHLVADVAEAMQDTTLSAATATMAVIALRVLPRA